MTQRNFLFFQAIVLSLVLQLILFAVSSADLLKGREAQKRGDYETAIKEFKSSADAGDEEAIFFLGNTYRKSSQGNL